MKDRIQLVYSKDYVVDIGSHVFPTSKYPRIRKKLESESLFKDILDFIAPLPASDVDILSVHEKSYLDKLRNGNLAEEEIFRLELPYSKALVDASILCCGGTILASEIALRSRMGIHIGGGFHHAFPDHGEGFCVLNDIAVAVRRLIENGYIERALIIDCDLHQGNGTAAIFAKDPHVFTFSIHQENNYPFFKPGSTMDIGLRDRASDREYLASLYEKIPRIISDFKPQFLMYVAGADPYKEDMIGGLALTKEGLRKRDEFIYQQAINYDIPIAVVLAGGYAVDEADTAEIHYNTVETGLGLFYPRTSPALRRDGAGFRLRVTSKRQGPRV